LPDDVADETAARVLLKAMTVHYLIQRVHAVQRGEFVLLHAAAGGVGLLACQWLKALGARVIGTVSSDAKAALAESHGCEFPIVYTRQSFPQRVAQITDGKLVRVAYDSVGKDTVLDSLRCIAPRGLLVSFGNASGKPPAIDLGLLSERGSLFVTRPKLADYVATRPELLDAANAVFEALRQGHISPNAGPTFALTEVREAHEALESRSTTGALLLVP
jgi:NADPH2:quinone reductase